MLRWLGVLAWTCAIGIGDATDAQAQSPPAALVVAARDLPRGWVLEPADLVAPDGSELGQESAPVGWVTRRVVTQGEPLRAPTIAPADVIRSGETVQLVWAGDGLELRVAGRAMNSAAAGDRVQVRVGSNRRFEGIATAPGVVRLDSPEPSSKR